MNKLLPIFALAALLNGPVFAHDTAKDMAKAASDFLNSLTEDQKKKATYDLTTDERQNWHFIPKPFEGEGKRGGLPISEMKHEQQLLALALLSTGLGHDAYVQALQIMTLEQVLFEIEKKDHRDPKMYYVSIFGEPGAKAWGWRVEGHHVSMNFTVADDKVVAGTPIFFASNPAEILDGPRKGLRVLAAEEDVARKLIKSLDDAQKKEAIIMDKAPRDILTSAERKVAPLEGGGLAYGKLNDEQKKLLGRLIGVYVKRLRPDVAKDELATIDAELDKVVFAWAGGFEKNEPHYYRVQGPTFLLEYANTQNGANHVHAVWRDFDGDFGEDVLAKHYAEFHAKE
ncbi:MAG: DUF3500 domain-containing protein [Verrucomicrobiales bacterium]|nr:DUF3500 domain-containing protein [Verrucomicrobiales bacterium]